MSKLDWRQSVEFERDENPQTGGGFVRLRREIRVYFDPRRGESLGELIDRLWREAQED